MHFVILANNLSATERHQLQAAIDENSKDWFNYTPDAWLLCSETSPANLSHALRSGLSGAAYLMVMQIDRAQVIDGMLPEQAWRWLRQHGLASTPVQQDAGAVFHVLVIEVNSEGRFLSSSVEYLPTFPIVGDVLMLAKNRTVEVWHTALLACVEPIPYNEFGPSVVVGPTSLNATPSVWAGGPGPAIQPIPATFITSDGQTLIRYVTRQPLIGEGVNIELSDHLYGFMVYGSVPTGFLVQSGQVGRWTSNGWHFPPPKRSNR